jgi:hypothetical protein
MLLLKNKNCDDVMGMATLSFVPGKQMVDELYRPQQQNGLVRDTVDFLVLPSM